MKRARAFEYKDPDYPIEISNGEGYGILLSKESALAVLADLKAILEQPK